jgi:hypothetical protein
MFQIERVLKMVQSDRSIDRCLFLTLIGALLVVAYLQYQIVQEMSGLKVWPSYLQHNSFQRCPA